MEEVKYSEDGKTLVRCPKSFQGRFVIPNGVTIIGNEAFAVCIGLTSVEIPDSVKEIGSRAFRSCGSLTSVEFPDSVTKIGIGEKDDSSWLNGGIFENCWAIKEPICNKNFFVYLPLSFEGKYIIPSGVSKICRCAFDSRRGMTSIEIPDSVTEIGNRAFENCTGLTSIEIPDSVTKIESYAFEGCTGLTSIEIPDSVTVIGSSAFKGCTGLTSIEIPDSVTEIGNTAFRKCQLKEIHIRCKNPREIEVAENAFEECAENCVLYVPIGTGYAYRHHPIFGKFKEVVPEK